MTIALQGAGLRTALEQVVLGSAGVYIQLTRFFVVLMVGVFVTRTVFVPIASRIAQRRDMDKKAAQSMENLMNIIGVFVAFTAALQAGEFGSLVTVIGTVAAAATVAVGWGMRDQVSSLVSGIFLHVWPSFVQGDYIRAGDVEGRVKSIKLSETRLRAPSGEKLVLPNNYLTTRPVTNQTRGNVTQDELTVDVAADKLAAASKILLDIAKDAENVLNTPEPTVQYRDMSADTVKTMLIFHIRDHQPVGDIKSTIIEQFNEQAVEQELLNVPETDEDEEDHGTQTA